ncbi:hypothetical protein [Oceanimonas smirnovii]|uniref:hypothetical protein n=1 Tax=Oceanimonas smirnovii TaxID=264574 RepID=UPI003FD132A3
MLSYLMWAVPVGGAIFMFAFKYPVAYRAIFKLASMMLFLAMAVTIAFAAGLDVAAKAVSASDSIDAEQLSEKISGIFPRYWTIIACLGVTSFYLSALLHLEFLPKDVDTGRD